MFIDHSPEIGQVEIKRHTRHKCKYCGVFVVSHSTALFCNTPTAICTKTLRLPAKSSQIKRVLMETEQKLTVWYIQELKEQTDQLCCPLMVGYSMRTSPSSAKTRTGFSFFVLCSWKTLLQPAKPCDWQLKCVCGDIQMFFHGNSWHKRKDEDMPTISKCNQALFFYHAAKLPKCNWIISFYNRLGATVWRTFDLFCITQKSVYELKHVNKPVSRITIPNITENCLTAWSAAFRAIVKGWEPRNVVICSKVGFITLRYHFVPVWVLICAPDLFFSPRDVEIFQWSTWSFSTGKIQRTRGPLQSARFQSSAIHPRPKKKKTSTEIFFLVGNVTITAFLPHCQSNDATFWGFFTPVVV